MIILVQDHFFRRRICNQCILHWEYPCCLVDFILIVLVVVVVKDVVLWATQVGWYPSEEPIIEHYFFYLSLSFFPSFPSFSLLACCCFFLFPFLFFLSCTLFFFEFQFLKIPLLKEFPPFFPLPFLFFELDSFFHLLIMSFLRCERNKKSTLFCFNYSFKLSIISLKGGSLYMFRIDGNPTLCGSSPSSSLELICKGGSSDAVS